MQVNNIHAPHTSNGNSSSSSRDATTTEADHTPWLLC
jgi:hypothetical protein